MYLLFKEIPELDSAGRPKMFFGRMIHDNCQRRQYFDNGIFAKNFGEMGCMLELGCKGPIAHCDSTTRLWNGGVNWCVMCGGVCLACTEPEFPNWPIYERMAEMPTSLCYNRHSGPDRCESWVEQQYWVSVAIWLAIL